MTMQEFLKEIDSHRDVLSESAIEFLNELLEKNNNVISIQAINNIENELKELENEKATMIFYEAPHRINEMLEDLMNVFGKDRKMSISREITKKFEEVYRGTIWEIMEQHNDYKGELVICVEGNTKNKSFDISIIDHINFYINDGYSQMDAIKTVAKERNLKKSDVYNEYMKNQGK